MSGVKVSSLTFLLFALKDFYFFIVSIYDDRCLNFSGIHG